MPRYEKGFAIWWPANEISYRLDQVYFLLEHVNTLRDGKYPPDPGETVYNNAGWKASRNTKANFITPAEIIAELDRRLLRCGVDWYLVNDHYEDGLTVEEIAKLHHLDYDDTWNRIQRAIAYCASGPAPRWVATEKRKGLDYDKWMATHWRPSEKLTKFRNHVVRVSHA
jgi:hypothetical protein